jgi:vitamin B12 transporter
MRNIHPTRQVGATKRAPYRPKNLALIILLWLGSTLFVFSREPEELPELTVIALRTPTPLNEVGNTVTRLNADQLQQEGILQLDEALKYVPGTISESIGGQLGSSSSFFLRGTVTGQTHLRVDGVRISGPNISTNNFLGGSPIAGLSAIEILRGPQSALYGGDAIGGVIGLYTRKGSGDPSGKLDISGGSFGTLKKAVYLNGELERLNYAIGLGSQETRNSLPNNQFDQNNYTLRFDFNLTENFDVGMTFRGFDSSYQRPDYRSETYPAAFSDRTESAINTIFGQFNYLDFWTTKLTIGHYDEQYDSRSLSEPNSYLTSGKKSSIYWDNTLDWSDHHTTVTGLIYESTDFFYRSQFFGLSADHRSSNHWGLYLNHIWHQSEALTLNSGIRWEEYDTYGSEVTWRTAASYLLSPRNTKLRMSAGKGFRAPSFIELYGFGGGSNFSLSAEESLGWDLGIDHSSLDGNLHYSLTYFENHLTDRIESTWDPQSFSTSYRNSNDDSLTNGFELSIKNTSRNNAFDTSLIFTHLNKSFSGQPKNSGSVRISRRMNEELIAGFNLHYLGQRNWGGDQLNPYLLTNLFTRYQASQSLELYAQIENLLDKNYQYYSGFGEIYPGRGRALLVGATLSF